MDAGVSRATVYRLRDRGELVAVGRGVMQFPEDGAGTLSDLAAVSARVPHGTVCLNSSLAYWDLTDEIPRRVHLAVARGTHPPTVDRPLAQVHVFDAATFALERERALTDVDEPFWIYSAERTIVDAVRMSRWVGSDVGLHALRRYVERGGARPARLTDLARELGGYARIARALEALLS